jgi:hypothetical protein
MNFENLLKFVRETSGSNDSILAIQQKLLDFGRKFNRDEMGLIIKALPCCRESGGDYFSATHVRIVGSQTIFGDAFQYDPVTAFQIASEDLEISMRTAFQVKRRLLNTLVSVADY